MSYQIVPITQKEANLFVKQHHRHHKPVVGSVFQIAFAFDEKIIGVAIVGRPVARKLDNGFTLEVNRLCTDGIKRNGSKGRELNTCSILYSAAWRIAKELGYKRLITYILSSEKGTSLYASNWKLIGEKGGGNWNVKSRPRVDTELTQKKLLFEAV